MNKNKIEKNKKFSKVIIPKKVIKGDSVYTYKYLEKIIATDYIDDFLKKC